VKYLDGACGILQAGKYKLIKGELVREDGPWYELPLNASPPLTDLEIQTTTLLPIVRLEYFALEKTVDLMLPYCSLHPPRTFSPRHRHKRRSRRRSICNWSSFRREFYHGSNPEIGSPRRPHQIGTYQWLHSHVHGHRQHFCHSFIGVCGLDLWCSGAHRICPESGRFRPKYVLHHLEKRAWRR
jgi:hypothetical protein